MVRNRAFLDSIIRVPSIEGTLQPNPRHMGIKLFPCNPMMCMNLSITNAARAIYPTFSRKVIEKKNIARIGTKVKTDPTPPMIPLTKMPLTHHGSFERISFIRFPNEPTIFSKRPCSGETRV
jgi:hypothetical protein